MNRKENEMEGKDNNDARAMLKGIVGTKNETVDDVVKFMLDYAKSMHDRYKKAVKGDKFLPCSVVALRMEDTANRVKAALRRERAQWRAKVRKDKAAGR